MLGPSVSEEEDDSDTDNKNEFIDIDSLLKDYPRTREAHRLETISFLEIRAEPSKIETRRNKACQGVARRNITKAIAMPRVRFSSGLLGNDMVTVAR